MKDKYLQIRLSETEYKIIEEKARLMNTTKSDFLRQAAISKPVKGFDLQHFVWNDNFL